MYICRNLCISYDLFIGGCLTDRIETETLKFNNFSLSFPMWTQTNGCYIKYLNYSISTTAAISINKNVFHLSLVTVFYVTCLRLKRFVNVSSPIIVLTIKLNRRSSSGMAHSTTAWLNVWRTFTMSGRIPEPGIRERKVRNSKDQYINDRKKLYLDCLTVSPLPCHECIPVFFAKINFVAPFAFLQFSYLNSLWLKKAFVYVWFVT